MILDDVIVEQITVVASHLQCGVTHEPLKRERIAAAIHQILAGEGVTKRMDRSPLHTSGSVIPHNRKPQGILCEESVTNISLLEILACYQRKNILFMSGQIFGMKTTKKMSSLQLRTTTGILFAS